MTTATFGETELLNPTPSFAPETEETEKKTVYDAFRADIQSDPDVPKYVDLKVRGRDHFSVRYNTDVSLDKLDRWRKSATKHSKRGDEIDMKELNTLIIASQCNALLYDGVPQYAPEDNEPLTFRHADVIDLLKVFNYREAISKFFASDADILFTGNKILEAAGFDSDGNELDAEDEDSPFE